MVSPAVTWYDRPNEGVIDLTDDPLYSTILLFLSLSLSLSLKEKDKAKGEPEADT